MKNNKYLLMLILICTIGLACGGGGGSSDDKEENPSGNTTQTNYRSPLPSDTLPASSGMNTWYDFKNDYYGLALTGTTFAYDSDSFEELYYFWDGDSWEMYLGLKGTLPAPSGSEYNAVLKEIYMSGTGGMKWYASGTDEFDEYCFHVWSKTGDTARVFLSNSGSILTYKRDTTGDDAYTSKDDISKIINNAASTTLKGHGKYPYLQYIGLGFHNSHTQFSSYCQLMSMTDELLDDSEATLVSSITIELTDPTGKKITPPAFQWFDSREEWGRNNQSLTEETYGGIWRVSKITIKYKNSSSAVYSAATAYDNYSVTYTTDTGYASTATTDRLIAQDYMSPTSAGSLGWGYIQTVPNDSSVPDTTDTVIYLYTSGHG